MKLRILWHSVAPYIFSGYGVVTKHIALRIAQYYPLVISCYYGMDPGGSLRVGGVRVLPTKPENWGEYSVKHYIQKLKITLPILMSDFWPFKWFSKLPNAMCYGPLDSEDYIEEDIECLKNFTFFVSPSKFGAKVYKKVIGKEPYDIIPHGVDTKIYHPYPKEPSRKLFNLPLKKFIIGIVAANSDPEPRKGWDDLFVSFKDFLEKYPCLRKKVLLFAFTNPSDTRGLDLVSMAKKLGLEDNIRFPEHFAQILGLPEIEMAKLYSSFDVYVNASRREGFCIPVIEAQACGVPVIAPNSTSLTELVKGHGWLVRAEERVFSPRGWPCRKVDREDLTKKIEEAFFNEDLRKTYSKKSLKFARKFDWEKIFREKWLPLLRRLERKSLNKISSN